MACNQVKDGIQLVHCFLTTAYSFLTMVRYLLTQRLLVNPVSGSYLNLKGRFSGNNATKVSKARVGAINRHVKWQRGV